MQMSIKAAAMDNTTSKEFHARAALLTLTSDPTSKEFFLPGLSQAMARPAPQLQGLRYMRTPGKLLE